MASLVGSVDYERAMQFVFTVKNNASMLTKLYIKGFYRPLINYAKRAWGHVPSFMMEELPLDVETGSANTTLAAFVAESYLLYLRNHRMKNLIISIVGTGGSGKTTYAVNACLGAYRVVGVSRGLAERLVNDSIFFDMESFVKALKMILNNNIWVPCIIADDIGEWLPKYWREMGITGIVHFFNLLDQAKDWVGVLIFTARSFKGSVAANIRHKSDYIVDASERILDGFRVDVFEWYLNKDWSEKDTRGKKMRMQFVDVIPATAKMPDYIWRRMREARRRLASGSLQVLEKLMEYLPAIEKKYLARLEKKYMSQDKSNNP